MLANQKLLIETMQACHRHNENILSLVSKVCAKMSLADIGSECEQDVNERFKKLEARVLSDLGSGEGEPKGTKGDSQLLKKMTNRMSDFESQVSAQIQQLTQDVEKKISFLGSQRAGLQIAHEPLRINPPEERGSEGGSQCVKRIVLACERDMEDFTAAMDAVNVDLDEMRARVDSTHSIITSRQRVEATVTAEISTIRLDMGDMQEALKAHDAWMEDVSQSYVDDTHQIVSQRLDERVQHCKDLENALGRHSETHQQIHSKMDTHREDFETRT
eukprot:g21134.t1